MGPSGRCNSAHNMCFNLEAWEPLQTLTILIRLCWKQNVTHDDFSTGAGQITCGLIVPAVSCPDGSVRTS